MEGFGSAAGHDGEGGGLGADLAAGHGSVDPSGALGKTASGFDVGGAEIDDQGVGVEAFGEAVWTEDDFLDHAGVGEIDPDDTVPDFAGEGGEGGGSVHAQGGGGFGGARAPVPDPDFCACMVEVAGHGAAHVAETDESNLVPC